MNRRVAGRRSRIAAVACASALMGVGVAAQDTAPSVWDGVYADAQAQRGQEIYVTTCAQCHGPALAGVESAPPLTGGQFNANWSGTTLADLAERIRTTMPVDKPGTLSRPQLAAVIAYILKMDGFPSGEMELEPQYVTSSPIRILSTKP
jgi:S-disulfanyl-L-cysteine oxidoreductase SoxD